MTDSSAWPALVLTAGLGTRLRPLSLVRAKAALPVAGDVLVRRVLRWLRAAGVRRVVLNLHHRPDTITPHVGDGRDLGLEVRYSWECPVLGSAGGPRHALPLLDSDRFLIVNGDTLTNASLSELTERHLATGARVTMTVTTGDARYGGVLADADDIVHGFAAPHQPQASEAAQAPWKRFHFVGIQAVERTVFDPLPDNVLSETVRWLYPQLVTDARGSVRVYRTSEKFHDIGTPADYLRTTRAFAASAGGTQIGQDVRIDPTADVTGSILWDRVTVGPNAKLIDCIVADDVVIPADATYRDKAIVTQHGELLVEAI